jgi:iron complex transport system substrate-binding protein
MVIIIKLKYLFVLLFLFIFNFFVYSEEYKRIISMSPSVTNSLYELNEEKNIKGITIYCKKGIIKKECIGTILEPNIEKIISIFPDLIIFSEELYNKSIINKFKKCGFNTYIVCISNDFYSLCNNYYNLSVKLKKTKISNKKIFEAKCLIENNNKKINYLKNKQKIFWVIGTNPLYTTGNKSFFNDYNNYTNTSNVYDDIDINYFSVNIENVIERNPDIIFIVDDKNIAKKEIKKLEKYTMINAIKNKKIFIIGNNDVLISTPLNFAKSVIMLTKIIYG